MTQLVVRPFHETVVEAIRTCGPASSGRIFMLTRLIRDTVIPTGHDQIIAAIDEFFDFPGSTKYAREIREVKESLLAQKQAASEKPTGKKIVVTLRSNDLHACLEGHPEIWGCGSSPYTAIGNLISAHSEKFGAHIDHNYKVE